MRIIQAETAEQLAQVKALILEYYDEGFGHRRYSI